MNTSKYDYFNMLHYITSIEIDHKILSVAILPADSRRAVVSYWQKYVHLVLINCLGGLSLPRNIVCRFIWYDLNSVDLAIKPQTNQQIHSKNSFDPFLPYSLFEFYKS